eukprot:4160632-Pyramimonas_sp.AAC.1
MNTFSAPKTSVSEQKSRAHASGMSEATISAILARIWATAAVTIECGPLPASMAGQSHESTKQ